MGYTGPFLRKFFHIEGVSPFVLIITALNVLYSPNYDWFRACERRIEGIMAVRQLLLRHEGGFPLI